MTSELILDGQYYEGKEYVVARIGLVGGAWTIATGWFWEIDDACVVWGKQYPDATRIIITSVNGKPQLSASEADNLLREAIWQPKCR